MQQGSSSRSIQAFHFGYIMHGRTCGHGLISYSWGNDSGCGVLGGWLVMVSRSTLHNAKNAPHPSKLTCCYVFCSQHHKFISFNFPLIPFLSLSMQRILHGSRHLRPSATQQQAAWHTLRRCMQPQMTVTACNRCGTILWAAGFFLTVTLQPLFKFKPSDASERAGGPGDHSHPGNHQHQAA